MTSKVARSQKNPFSPLLPAEECRFFQWVDELPVKFLETQSPMYWPKDYVTSQLDTTKCIIPRPKLQRQLFFAMSKNCHQWALINIHTWLSANKLSLNIEKSNYILSHPPQKRLQGSTFNLLLYNKELKRKYCIMYLGILIDSHLSWKHQVEFIAKIIRSIGILSKLRYHINLNILLKLYYALIYPFLIYGIIIKVWGTL